MRLILISVLMFSFAAQAAEWNLRTTVEVDPQYRHLNQQRIVEKNELWESYGLVNSHLEVTEGSFFFEAKPEIRAITREGKQNPLSMLSVKTGQRVLDSRRTLYEERESEAYFDFDRLNLRYTLSGVEVYAGRRPLTLGVLRFFPVWNKLTLPLIFEPGPEWIENPDIAGASVQIGAFSYRLFASRGERPQVDDLVLGEVRYFGTGYEIQALAGYWWQHSAAGLAGSVDVYDNTLRFESLWISSRKDEVAQGQIGVGLETALNDKITLVTEGLYQSAGLDEVQNVKSAPNRFMGDLAGKGYALPYVLYQVHPLWSLQAGSLIGVMESSSAIGLAAVEHSLGDNTTMTLKVKWPFGDSTGEFGSERVTDPFGRRLGLASSVMLKLQTVF